MESLSCRNRPPKPGTLFYGSSNLFGHGRRTRTFLVRVSTNSCARYLRGLKWPHATVIPSLWVVSRYFRDNRAVIRADTEFEIAWDWRVCEISETWRKHNKARRLEGKSPTNPNSGDSITSTFTARHLQDISAQISVLSEEFSKDHSQARAILSDLVAPGREPHLSDPSSTTVFVDGLPPLVSEDTLRILFAPFGDTHYVRRFSSSRILNRD